MKRALITGITGQDGSYLAELLLEKGYHVVGMTRRSSQSQLPRIEHILERITVVQGDLLDEHSLNEAVREAAPDEVYNLAAQTFVPASWNQPILTGEFTGLGVTRMLEAVRRYAPEARFYQAGSSEMFGKVAESPQSERTPFYPRSPYGVAKVYAHWITVNYRESFDMYAVNGIAFNHESPRRGVEFVTRKITHAAARIARAGGGELALGNLEARRDWGFAGDVVRAMWLSLQADDPEDYVIGTGVAWSVRDFCEAAFSEVGLDYSDYVILDSKLYRPAEVDVLLADASKLRAATGWRPEVSFEEMVKMMVAAE